MIYEVVQTLVLLSAPVWIKGLFSLVKLLLARKRGRMLINIDPAFVLALLAYLLISWKSQPKEHDLYHLSSTDPSMPGFILRKRIQHFFNNTLRLHPELEGCADAPASTTGPFSCSEFSTLKELAEKIRSDTNREIYNFLGFTTFNNCFACADYFYDYLPKFFYTLSYDYLLFLVTAGLITWPTKKASWRAYAVTVASVLACFDALTVLYTKNALSFLMTKVGYMSDYRLLRLLRSSVFSASIALLCLVDYPRRDSKLRQKVEHAAAKLQGIRLLIHQVTAQQIAVHSNSSLKSFYDRHFSSRTVDTYELPRDYLLADGLGYNAKLNAGLRPFICLRSSGLSLLGAGATRLPSLCRSIDAVIEGGLLPGTVTEIYGGAGTAKTHLCYQFSTALKAIDCKSRNTLYIDCENNLAAKKFTDFRDGSIDPSDRGGLLFVKKVFYFDELFDFCSRNLAFVLGRHFIGLIIVDSIAALTRSEANKLDTSHKTNRLISILREYALKTDSWIIVVNQTVSAELSHESATDSVSLSNHCDIHSSSIDATLERAALGMSWTFNVDTRILLLREPLSGRDSCSLLVVKSNYLSPRSCTFSLSNDGVIS